MSTMKISFTGGHCSLLLQRRNLGIKFFISSAIVLGQLQLEKSKTDERRAKRLYLNGTYSAAIYAGTHLNVNLLC